MLYCLGCFPVVVLFGLLPCCCIVWVASLLLYCLGCFPVVVLFGLLPCCCIVWVASLLLYCLGCFPVVVYRRCLDPVQVFHRRVAGSTAIPLNLEDYKHGFGNMSDAFWLGRVLFGVVLSCLCHWWHRQN